MPAAFLGLLKLTVTQESWPFAVPFRISGRTSRESRTITVTLESGGQVGRGEASGVYYKGETVETMLQQLESVRPAIESGLTRGRVQHLSPAAGARNALDCALWDLEAKLLCSSDRGKATGAGGEEPVSPRTARSLASIAEVPTSPWTLGGLHHACLGRRMSPSSSRLGRVSPSCSR